MKEALNNPPFTDRVEIYWWRIRVKMFQLSEIILDKVRKHPYLFIAFIIIISITIFLFYEHFILGWTKWANGTGFGSYIDSKGEYHQGKTLWDWLQLLIIPTILGIGALLFNQQERQREQRINAERNQETTLQNYLDNITKLILTYNLRETQGIKGRINTLEIQNVAQVRTVTALRQLDSSRRNIVFQFLRDSDLSGFILVSAPLDMVDLSFADMNDYNLNHIHLYKANLLEARLMDANLSSAIMSEANLIKAALGSSNISKARLRGANLSQAYLSSAILNEANLNQTNLTNAILEGADLRKAHMKYADLSGAYLLGADLSGADLDWADLSGANLGGAIITNEQLAQAKSLEGAIMPDGSKHE